MTNRLDVTAAILAGGLGTRLRSVVVDRPKVLAPVGGAPYLHFLLERLARAAIRDVVLLAGHGAEQVRDTIGDSYDGMAVRYSVEQVPLGTAGALRHALPFLDCATVLLLNGDSWCDAGLVEFRQFHRVRAAGASLVVAGVADTSRFGRVSVDGAGRVKAFEEKGAAGRGWINAGMYLLERALVETLPAGPLSLERDVLPGWVSEGRVFGFRHAGRFLDIGTPESYVAAEEFFGAQAEPVLAGGG